MFVAKQKTPKLVSSMKEKKKQNKTHTAPHVLVILGFSLCP